MLHGASMIQSEKKGKTGFTSANAALSLGTFDRQAHGRVLQATKEDCSVSCLDPPREAVSFLLFHR